MTQSPHRATPEMAMTLEFVTYNGNMDMFTHARVKFELQPTGFLDTTVRLGREMAGSRHAILRFHVSFIAFSRQLRKDTLLPFFSSACPPVPHEQPNGAVGAPFTVVQPIAESKRDDPTHRESKTENENRNHAEDFWEIKRPEETKL